MGDPGAAPERRLPRFFVAPDAIAAARVEFDSAQVQQLLRVLRLGTGDRVIVCDGSGLERVTVLRQEGRRLWGVPDPPTPGVAEPGRAVWLYQAALRGDRFTWLLQKGTEIGVRGFVPVRYRHTQPADFASRADRYGAVVREAAEQCGRARLPELLTVLPFAEALAHSAVIAGATRLLLDERPCGSTLRDGLEGAGRSVCLFIGPEGGLADEERQQAAAAGLRPVTLGRSILRSETAGLVGAALALGAAGDLG